MCLTIEIVMRIGAAPGGSGCAGARSHTEACRVRSLKTLADATESGRSRNWIDCKNDRGAPTANSGDAAGTITITFSSPTAPMQEPTQNIPNELMDSPLEMGAQEHRERRKVRLNETLSCERSKRLVVKAKPAHPSMIARMMERLGSTAAPSSKDEATTGSLHAIDRIDVVTALVPKEIQFQNGEQESVAVVNREDPRISRSAK